MKLHHWFIPTKQNKFHPHALRTTGMVIVLIVLALVPPLYNVISVGKAQILGYAIDVNTADVLSASNQERINVGLAPLNLNSALVSAATAKANHMFANNYWAHIAPDGTTPWSFIATSGYSYDMAGENLAKDFNTSSGVVAGWMGSTTHRANVLNNDFKDVGYAVVNGTLLGNETTLIVAMYGLQPTPEVIATTTPHAQSPSEIVVKTPVTTTPTNNPTPVVKPEPVITTENADPTTTPNVTIKPVTEQPATTSQTNDINTTKPINNGNVAGTFISLPIKTYNSFNWGQKVSLLIASTMILLFIMKHTMIWRQQKRGLRHIWLRAHPIGQALVLGISIIVILANSIGVVL